MTKVFYAINISGNVIDLGVTREYLIVYNKKLEHIQPIQRESSLPKIKDNKTKMSSCPQVCLQMGSKHAKWGDKQRATTSWQTLGSVSKLAHT